MTIAAPTTSDSVVVVTATGILTVDAPLTVASNMTAQSGGVGTSRLQLGLPGSARVVAEVFDLAGRQVAVLADREFEAGEHSLSWSGTDSRGSRVGPELYFVRVEVLANTATPGRRFVRRVMRVE